ncbi:hypothetical protein BGZ47_000188 [Haplosporangium gracile]|nr:hypothetical protein BGZ47_000188 [Haplosporangium gracile]
MPANTVESVQISALDEDWEINIDWLSTATILLGDLFHQEWALAKFNELKLYIQLDEEQEEPDEEELIFSDPMPRWTIGLERFYRQIGALTQLRVLDLRVAVERGNQGSDGDYITYKDKTFPGLLTLENQSKGRLGWLQLLGGLGNLEVLCRLFNLDAMLPRLEFGQREANWVVEHWPKLKFIELYTFLKDTVAVYPAPVQSMLDQLPGLRVGRVLPKIDILWTRE